MNFTWQLSTTNNAVVDGQVVKFIIFIDGAKHLNFVDDGRNKYKLK